MPISADEFDSGGREAAKVLDFLRASAGTAFTISELLDEMSNTDVALDDVDYALRMLVDAEIVERADRGERVYYLYRPSAE